MWSAITAFLVGLFTALEGYYRYEHGNDAKDLKEAKQTIDKMSNRPVTDSDVHRMFERAKVTARERDKTK